MKLNVLIIEDDSIVAMHIERTVQYYGHHVIDAVESANDAFTVAKKHSLDLIVSDISIEGEMNGIECCRILQKEYHLSVILISAHNDLATLKNASTLDFVGYLIKPFREDELKMLLDLAILRKDSDVSTQRDSIDDKYSYCHSYQTLYRENEVVDLTHKEKRFLETILKAKGAIVPYNSFTHTIWQGEEATDEARRQLVYRFKRKLPDFPLKLLKGVGYKLEKYK